MVLRLVGFMLGLYDGFMEFSDVDGWFVMKLLISWFGVW